MNDKQLLDLIFTKPLNKEDFIDCLGRMSALVREHMCDIILIIKKIMEANNEQNNIEIEEKIYLENKINDSSINEEESKKSSVDKRLKEYKNKNSE
ncbi:hypothetical protein COBT_001281, partial [Conglomerata obtusa]